MNRLRPLRTILTLTTCVLLLLAACNRDATEPTATVRPAQNQEPVVSAVTPDPNQENTPATDGNVESSGSAEGNATAAPTPTEPALENGNRGPLAQLGRCG